MLSLAKKKHAAKSERLPAGWCEYCGRPDYTEQHHIKTRGAGGPDIGENLIRLCASVENNCHDRAQQYKIDRLELVQIVAVREGLTPQEVCLRIGIPVPDKFPPVREIKEPPTLEELIQAYINVDERQDECNFLKGQLLAALVEAGVKMGWIASQVRTSISQIKVLIRTYRSFPKEGMRIAELTWYHHRLAAHTDNPEEWAMKAADEEWSTRQMSSAIKKEKDPARAADEEDREKKKAEKVFRQVDEILAKGGLAGKWLKDELKKALCS